MEPGDWMCHSCDEINFKTRTVCRKCSTPVQGHVASLYSWLTGSNTKGRAGDWSCSCGELNFTNRNNCRKCKKNKLPSTTSTKQEIKVEPGDWICLDILCKEHNFKNRTMCRKCNLPKNTAPKKYIEHQSNILPQPDAHEDNLCVICLDKPKEYAITKCGHMCYCDKCGLNLNKCPICRTNYIPNQDIIKIFNA